MWTLRDILRGPEVHSVLHGNQGNGICYAFQEGLCEIGSSCSRQHVCIGCLGTLSRMQVPAAQTGCTRLNFITTAF